jgi:hypothetical protein
VQGPSSGSSLVGRREASWCNAARRLLLLYQRRRRRKATRESNRKAIKPSPAAENPRPSMLVQEWAASDAAGGKAEAVERGAGLGANDPKLLHTVVTPTSLFINDKLLACEVFVWI